MDARARFVDVGELRLYAELEGRGAPLLLLHGFTGSTRSMEGLARDLSGDYRTLRLDLAGHGRSDAPHAADLYAMPRCVDQVARAVRALCSGRVHVIGYSMGGRVALALCATHPELVASALLIGARAGIEDPEERAARRRDDAALADRIERDGVRAFVDAWMAQPRARSVSRIARTAWPAVCAGWAPGRSRRSSRRYRGSTCPSASSSAPRTRAFARSRRTWSAACPTPASRSFPRRGTRRTSRTRRPFCASRGASWPASTRLCRNPEPHRKRIRSMRGTPTHELRELEDGPNLRRHPA